METNTKLVLTRWIRGAAPESSHPDDMTRFYNVVYERLKSNDYINSDELAKVISENLKWDKNQINDFSIDTVIHIEKIIGFINFLKSEKQINIFNLLKE